MSERVEFDYTFYFKDGESLFIDTVILERDAVYRTDDGDITIVKQEQKDVTEQYNIAVANLNYTIKIARIVKTDEP